MNSLVPDVTGANLSVESVNGGFNDGNSPNPSTEASLDIQYSVPLAHRTLATYYTTGGRATMIADADHRTQKTREMGHISNSSIMSSTSLVTDFPRS